MTLKSQGVLNAFWDKTVGKESFQVQCSCQKNEVTTSAAAVSGHQPSLSRDGVICPSFANISLRLHTSQASRLSGSHGRIVSFGTQQVGIGEERCSARTREFSAGEGDNQGLTSARTLESVLSFEIGVKSRRVYLAICFCHHLRGLFAFIFLKML